MVTSRHAQSLVVFERSLDVESGGQLTALRFASDAEVPGLVRRVLADGITDRAAIKRMVGDWQADDLRV